VQDDSKKTTDDVFLDGLVKSIERFEALAEQNKRNMAEMLKLRQYMTATVALLDDDSREAWELVTDSVLKEADAVTASTLTEAIKQVLRASYPNWMAVANVRDQLIADGFDFSDYKSNELASVSTTLRRIQSDLEVDSSEDAIRYRLRPSGLPRSAADVRQVLDAAKRGQITLADQLAAERAKHPLAHTASKLRRVRAHGPPEKIPD
jgi:hypothetical protein